MGSMGSRRFWARELGSMGSMGSMGSGRLWGGGGRGGGCGGGPVLGKWWNGLFVEELIHQKRFEVMQPLSQIFFFLYIQFQIK